ncbi:DUF4907 domain-containing protein [Zobellia amurskyensis]|uniref:DUF4907 domain-containing protein n=2 Tax=Zobellia amurskyensis TaxID=248905 RepID=A0A7X3D155_9FLAO|nr:DUF4907 domain-containing protein [Zobellia amurskyensis]
MNYLSELWGGTTFGTVPFPYYIPMKTKKIHFLLATLIMVVAYITFNYSAVEANKVKPRLETIAVGEGYGYQILYEEKVLVKQEFIPAVQGERAFASKKEAKRVGDEVLKSIIKGEAPFVTISQLKDLKITNLED